MSDIQGILKSYYTKSDEYNPLKSEDFEYLKSVIDELLKGIDENPELVVENLSQITILIFLHFDTVLILLEKDLSELNYEISMALASCLLLDSGYFGASQFISAWFTPTSQEQLRMPMWDRFSSTRHIEIIKGFLDRDDLSTLVIDDIHNTLPRIEKY